jgi:hypothetical protein
MRINQNKWVQGVIIMGIFSFLFGCSQKKDDFPWDRRNTLVFYAVASTDAEPKPGTPSYVAKDFMEWDRKNEVFIVDGAPYLSELTIQDFRQEIQQALNNPKFSSGIKERLQKILAWAEGTKMAYILYQQEPPEMAGDGTARKKAMAAEKK